MVSNDITEMHNYAHYILRGIYYNYIHSDTGIAISRFLIFVVFVAFVIYAKYDYLLGFILLICVLEVSSSSMSTSNTPDSWLNIWSEIWPILHRGDGGEKRVGDDDDGESILNNLNKLTQGISLNDKEGFELSSILPSIPPITTADDRSLDYHTPNNFIKQSSQDFADNFFESKKCDLTGGIGSILMFGSNELIGSSRTVTLVSSYDYSGKIREMKANMTNDSQVINKNITSPDLFKQQCYKYFYDCVYMPIKRSQDLSGSVTIDFRDVKKSIYNDIDTKIMSFEKLLKRFNIANLNTSDLLNNPSNYTVGNIIVPPIKTATTTEPDNINIMEIDDVDESDFGRFINQVNSSTTDKNKNKKLEIYNKVYGYKIRLNAIFSGWRDNAKRYNNDIKLISISDTMLQEIRNIVNYLRVIQLTKLLIDRISNFPENVYDKIMNAVNSEYIPYGYTTVNSSIIRTSPDPIFTYFNGYDELYKLTDTFNVSDEQRYLYGISYFYNNIAIK
jgi:hypothetical protein